MFLRLNLVVEELDKEDMCLLIYYKLILIIKIKIFISWMNIQFIRFTLR